MTVQQPETRSHTKVVLSSLAVVVGMVAFVFLVLRPMYYLICEWTGVTGSSFDVVEAQPFEVQTDRPIRVQFLATNNANMPWQFRPVQTEITSHPGELVTVAYFARNTSRRDMVAQAVPSLTPFEATNFVMKTECFCFNNQELKAGQEMDMPLIFYVDPGLPSSVKTITLSYQLYDITEKAKPELAANY